MPEIATFSIYMLGFLAMFIYSLKCDVECGLEKSPREAFWFALFWPALITLLIIIILIEKVIKFIRPSKG